MKVKYDFEDFKTASKNIRLKGRSTCNTET